MAGVYPEDSTPAVWPMTGPGVPGILDERNAEFFRRTRKVPEQEEAYARVVEAMWPLVRGIEEDGYIYGKEIHYADFNFAAIMVWIQWAKEEDFEKTIKSTDIQDSWKDVSQYL